jgi:stage III sporulation protein AA
VIIGYDKAKAIEIATRTLSPDIIVCDEIGNVEELNSIKYGFSSGVSFAVSVHMKDESQLYTNEIIYQLIQAKEFDYLILLKSFTDEFEIIDLRSIKFENSRNDNDSPFFFLS